MLTMAAGFGSLYQFGDRTPLQTQTLALPPLIAHNTQHQHQLKLSIRYPQQQQQQSKGEALMIRIGIFSLAFLVPSVCVLASNWYEYVSRDSWLLKSGAAAAVAAAATGSSGNNVLLAASRPSVQVFLLKIFMSFVAGAACCVWIWTSRTVNTWRRFARRLMDGRRKQSLPWPLPAPTSAAYLQQAQSAQRLLKQQQHQHQYHHHQQQQQQHVSLLADSKQKRVKNGSKCGSETAV